MTGSLKRSPGETARPAVGPCRLCGSDDLEPFTAREMMLGWREVFTYLHCRGCQCLQIERVPEDLGRYYPQSYYSLRPVDSGDAPGTAGDGSAIPEWSLTMGELVGDLLLARGRGLASEPRNLAARAVSHYFGHLNLRPSARLLDVGCGRGSFLRVLRQLGFENLLGVDPFVGRDHRFGDGVEVLAGGLERAMPGWDLVTFHHSFEHVPNPAETLHQVAKRLAPGGTCLIRMPVVPCEAWEQYRGAWVQIDAPRHLFIHSVASLSGLLAAAGLRLAKVVFDSGFLQFLGSEQYRRDVPLTSERSFIVNPAAASFSFAQLTAFVQRAKWLNREGRGDQAAFYIVHAGDQPGPAAS